MGSGAWALGPLGVHGVDIGPTQATKRGCSIKGSVFGSSMILGGVCNAHARDPHTTLNLSRHLNPKALNPKALKPKAPNPKPKGPKPKP